MSTGPEEVELAGGTANRGEVHRVGATVRRPCHGSTPAVHAVLRHLEAVGFEGAPRALGVDGQGREILTFLEGTVPIAPYPRWAFADDALVGLAALLRRYHDAVSTFDASPYRWQVVVPPGFGPPLVSHNDPNLDNVVFRSGRPAALIDFDLAAPGSRTWDLAIAARLWAPLRPDDSGSWPDGEGRALARFRLLLDAYGLARADRLGVVEAVVPSHDWIYGLIGSGARAGHRGFGRYWTESTMARAARHREWYARHGTALRRAAG